MSETAKNLGYYPNSKSVIPLGIAATTYLLTVKDIGSVYTYYNRANQVAARAIIGGYNISTSPPQ